LELNWIFGIKWYIRN